MKKIILKTKYAEVYYDTETKLGVVDWNSGTIPSPAYREAYSAMLEYSIENKKTELSVDYFIADTSKQGVVLPEDRKWFLDEVFPKAVKTGVFKGAIIVGGGVFKKYYINLILKATKKYEVPIKVFSSQQAAKKWLFE